MKRVLVLSDNERLFLFLLKISEENNNLASFTFACSPKSPLAKHVGRLPISLLDINKEVRHIIEDYELIISAHSKQIFPPALVESRECINIHPGYNPDTRGWYPQVFAIVYGLRAGVTIHRMDRYLDHGPIIFRAEVPVHMWDTSETLYERILECEEKLLETKLADLVTGDYFTYSPENEGHLFLKKDYESLCEMKLQDHGTFLEFFNRLRALSFSGYDNAFIADPSTGEKIHLKINIKPHIND